MLTSVLRISVNKGLTDFQKKREKLEIVRVGQITAHDADFMAAAWSGRFSSPKTPRQKRPFATAEARETATHRKKVVTNRHAKKHKSIPAENY